MGLEEGSSEWIEAQIKDLADRLQGYGCDCVIAVAMTDPISQMCETMIDFRGTVTAIGLCQYASQYLLKLLTDE